MTTLHSYDIALAVRENGRKGFIARYPDPFFLQLSDANDPLSNSRAFKTAAALPAAAVKLSLDGYEMTRDLARVTLYVVAKDPDNPWKDRIIVGRARNNDVSIDHASISKVHAYVSFASGEYGIIDAGSLNGSWLNGRRLTDTQRARLPFGAKVRLGAVLLEFIDAAQVYDRFKDGVQPRREPPRRQR